ncbi:sulfatase-like hydrolase/transferase, partial [Akkermansiaceae bacterium]|nr:sulfatase-like hydrolase/transferase [Akkermansiaceae bacterium]
MISLSRSLPVFHTILAIATSFAQAKSSPNVILIMSDDQGWGDVGFNGHSDLKTPHLDAMAANGVKFNRFYAASPLCSPTRGSCLTGRNPFRFGILAAHTAGMRTGEITVAEMAQSK